MKKKHLWFLLPTVFAMIFVELMIRHINISLSLLSLVCMIYTSLIALNKQD
jgi:hypothetical protein